MHLKRREFSSQLYCALLGIALPAWAEGSTDAGESAVQLIVPNPPGGTVDTVARLIGRLLQENAGLKTLVTNISGGSHVIAANALVNAPRPDEVLLYATTNLLSYVPMLAPETLRFSPEEELIPVATVGIVQQLLVAHKEVNVAALIDRTSRAAGRQMTITMGSLGAASATYFHARKLAQILQLDMTIVPYRGMADLSMALLSGQVQTGFVDELAAQQLVATGKVHPVAAMSTRPCILFPTLPMWHQLGRDFAAIDMDRPFTVLSGRRMSSERRKQLAGLFMKLDRLPQFHAGMRELGIHPTLISGEAARKYLREVVAHERRLIEHFNQSRSTAPAMQPAIQ